MRFLGIFDGGHSFTMDIVLGVVVLGIVIFVAVTSFLNRNNRKKERDKRTKEVKEKIKEFIREKESKKNIYIEFEKIISRKGKETKNRDVFEVIINIFDARTRKHLEDRAYEIEGISIPIDRKNFRHDWVINARLDLEHTRKRLKILEGEIELSKEEKKILRQQNKEAKIKKKEQEKETAKLKSLKNEDEESLLVDIDEKFIPKRKKQK